MQAPDLPGVPTTFGALQLHRQSGLPESEALGKVLDLRGSGRRVAAQQHMWAVFLLGERWRLEVSQEFGMVVKESYSSA